MDDGRMEKIERTAAMVMIGWSVLAIGSIIWSLIGWFLGF